MRAALLLITAAVAAALLLSEAAMRPSPGDRLVLVVLFATMAAVTVAAAWLLPRWAERRTTLRGSLLVVSLSAVSLAAVVVAAAALTMFLSPHDLRLVLVALVLGLGLGGALAFAIARPLAADLETLASAAHAISSDGPPVRTGVHRRDEVGDVARAIELMATGLADAHAEREADEATRREFLAAISHDLRTPLTAIQAALEALEDGMAPDPQRYMQSIGQELAVLRRLVDDLFLLARIEASDLRLEQLGLDLTELADAAVEGMSALAQSRNVGVRLSAPPQAFVTGDPHALGRVLRNLLDNAIRHAPAASTVVLEAASQDGTVTVTVRDDGVGFPASFVETALQSFTKADLARTPGSGTGLGLAIARGFVEAHGGRLWVEPGPGGVVSFTLPARP